MFSSFFRIFLWVCLIFLPKLHNKISIQTRAMNKTNWRHDWINYQIVENCQMHKKRDNNPFVLHFFRTYVHVSFGIFSWNLWLWVNHNICKFYDLYASNRNNPSWLKWKLFNDQKASYTGSFIVICIVLWVY